MKVKLLIVVMLAVLSLFYYSLYKYSVKKSIETDRADSIEAAINHPDSTLVDSLKIYHYKIN
jgi:hypothetical protein